MNLRSMHGKTLLLALIVVGAILVLASHSFRTTRQDHPDLGTLTYKYRWGNIFMVLLDADQDGQIDGRYRVPTSRGYAEWHPRYVEGWESSRCDGAMDIHWYHDASGGFSVELDRNGDGAFEERYEGTKAEVLLSEEPRAASCLSPVRRLQETEN